MSANVEIPSADAVIKDPYAYREEDVAEPPNRLGAILKRIGPCIILAASIVGSSESMASTSPPGQCATGRGSAPLGDEREVIHIEALSPAKGTWNLRGNRL